MSIKIGNRFLKNIAKAIAAVLALAVLIMATHAVAAGPSQGLALSAISANIGTSVTDIAKIMSNVALIAGVGFILAAFFKFHQHKLNPTQVPLSQGITLLLIGTGLTLFPVMIPTARNTIAGTAAISKISGGGINTLIGGTG